MRSFIKSINGTYHIPLFNTGNRYCFFITVIQRLHSSVNLNRLCYKLINDPDIVNYKQCDNIFKIMITPLVIYSKLDHQLDISTDNAEQLCLEIYREIDAFMDWFSVEVVGYAGRHGYPTHYALFYFFMPCIYKLFPNDFMTIVRELHFYRIDFNNVDHHCKNTILDENKSFLLKVQHRKIILKAYTEMISHIPAEYRIGKFVSAILDVTPSNNDDKIGHAIVLIKCHNSPRDDAFYVIDDQNAMETLTEYIEKRKQRLYEICIRDVDEITMANINSIIRAFCKIDPSCKFSKYVTRYVLNFDRNFTDITDYMLKEELKTNDELAVDESNKMFINHDIWLFCKFLYNANSALFRKIMLGYMMMFVLGMVLMLLIVNIRRRHHYT